jgi:hypothetical protein
MQPAISYIRDWIEFQVRASQQPGCIVAIAHRGKIVAEYALGMPILLPAKNSRLATGSGLHRIPKVSPRPES